jgi:hypothetical protein
MYYFINLANLVYSCYTLDILLRSLPPHDEGYIMINYSKDGMIDSLYGMAPPTKEALGEIQKKVDIAIKQMGDRYLLAKPVERLNG